MIRRLLAAALLVGGSPCAAQTPVIQVYDSVRGGPVRGARIVAYGVSGHDTTRAQADSDCTFRSSPPGPELYVIRITALGYWPRVDTLILDTGRPRRIGLLMQEYCNGPCRPDPYRVAAARAARAAWGCATDTVEIAARRVWWLSQLGSSAFQGSLDGLPSLNALRMRPAVVPKPRLVHDRAACRRAAAAMDRAGLLVGTAVTVFRYRGYLLVSQAGEAPFILSKRYRVVHDFRGE